ncbi:DUF6460 domain-containing protein [Pseudemcibacter aquimaris]|uniref:DUF6460 domain-containing protein n=1 Tax=Pseudemcibacter aquimaris TaxID=2857064 RepID=UPI00201187BE|nr:DUF6460 domain-containing protein [Pseudemcibacter aquimaris]MCC3861336.1 DUF6460 domain-containing protein [Pseudemcibacter aquimaris]WDU58108.1 hypothetical protein KW060_13000 [Pseudemcibacter aquimaris]
MDKTTSTLIWKLIIASLCVGLLLSFFNIDPVELINNVPETLGRILEVVLDVINWAGKYILLGAIIVIPIYVIFNFRTIFEKLFSKKK